MYQEDGTSILTSVRNQRLSSRDLRETLHHQACLRRWSVSATSTTEPERVEGGHVRLWPQPSWTTQTGRVRHNHAGYIMCDKSRLIPQPRVTRQVTSLFVTDWRWVAVFRFDSFSLSHLFFFLLEFTAKSLVNRSSSLFVNLVQTMGLLPLFWSRNVKYRMTCGLIVHSLFPWAELKWNEIKRLWQQLWQWLENVCVSFGFLYSTGISEELQVYLKYLGAEKDTTTLVFFGLWFCGKKKFLNPSQN